MKAASRLCAAAAAFATGAFRNTTGTVAADTVTTTSHGNGAATSSAPHPTDPTDPTASGSGSPNPTDSPTPPPSPTDTTGTTASPTPAPTPTPAATSTVGTVTIDPSLVADPRAVPIATLFDTFFSAVNTKNFDAALALYDPSGDVNVSDPKQRASFKKSEATSTDDQGVLKTLSPGGTDPVTTAEVTFRSRQQAGYGPSDNPNQTCSVWTLTYTLSYTDGKYLIKGASGSHTGC